MKTFLQWKKSCLFYLFLGTNVLLHLSCGSKIVKFPPTAAEISFVAIGDTGEPGDILTRNAAVLKKMYREDKFDALIFLGDNFYPIGLNIARKELPDKIASVLDPFGDLLDSLGRQNVHTITGNHDYYSFLAINRSFLFGLFKVAAGPYGFNSRGNQRAREIKKWSYYYGMPQQAIYGVDGNKIQMIFFDSALPLRVEPATWKPALDSLYQLLLAHKNDAGIKWRLLFVHHPFYSLGPHGGYNFWDEEGDSLVYLNPCSRGSSPITYALNLIDPEDLCDPKYRTYIDSVRTLIRRSAVPVQAVIGGHEHSLQLLYYPEDDSTCTHCPKVHVVSGAGSKANRVKATTPLSQEYTWPIITEKEEDRGKSAYGFVRFDLKADTLHVRFYDGETGEVLGAEGQTAFKVTTAGKLVAK